MSAPATLRPNPQPQAQPASRPRLRAVHAIPASSDLNFIRGCLTGRAVIRWPDGTTGPFPPDAA